MEKSTNKVLAGIVALVVAIAALVATVGNRPVAQIDRSKPEGVVQAYLQAVLARDFDQAATYFATTSTCTADNLVAAYIPENATVSLGEVTVTASSANVTVSVEISSGEPLGSRYTETHTYRLVTGAPDNTWKLTGTPWPLYDCGVLK